MRRNKRKTVGELSLQALNDPTIYEGIEVAEAQLWKVPQEVFDSAHAHLHKIDEEEFFVIMVRAGDPLIWGVVRQKFYSYPHMPSPRPEQAVWLYNKALDKVRFLWSLPPAKVMAAISEAPVVSKNWARTKAWCDAFFGGYFWHHIRDEHKIKHLSEIEYLKTHREELIKAGAKEFDPGTPNPFDFGKITTNEVVNPQAPIPDQSVFQSPRQA